jgi:alpha-tubulin suppressor-like RCC1 family protein
LLGLILLVSFIATLANRVPSPIVFGDNTSATSTLWAWGWNGSGQLGDGTTDDKNTPTQIGSATGWSAIAVGWNHTVALKSDGTLWAWGDNTYGQLGDGTNTRRSTPTQESTGAANWSAISGGGEHTVALKSDGTLWAWGRNHNGQLGDGTTAEKYTPTQIRSETNWTAIAATALRTVALKSDGTLWSWGRNDKGQLGDGTNTDRSTPTQESTEATNWTKITGGGYDTVALKSDGTLWAWGHNYCAQLGDGTTSDRNTPTQESTGATDWTAISGSTDFTVALKSDGTLWSWGCNSKGQLGDGTTTNRSTPTQESTGATDWYAIAARTGTVALK